MPQQWNNDRPAHQGPTIRGDVLSCARAESGDDCAAPVYVAVPTALHVAELAVKRDGISRNRTADAAIVAREQIDRSSPDGHKEIFPRLRLGADPRTPPGRPPPQRPAPPPAAHAPAGDTGNSAGDGTGGHLPSSAMSGWHANAASGPPPLDMPDRNTATGHIRAQRTARSLSTGSGAASAHGKNLAPNKIVDHHGVDPRERSLPQVKSWRGASTPLRDALFLLPYSSASLYSRLIAPTAGRQFPAGRPPTIAGQPPRGRPIGSTPRRR
jgi:hypothetical protein